MSTFGPPGPGPGDDPYRRSGPGGGQPSPFAPPPVAPPPRRRQGRLAVVVTSVVVLLLCPGLGLAGWALVRAADEAGGPGAPPVGAAEPTGTSSTARATPGPRLTLDGFAVGDCVVNDGTDVAAELRTVPCGPDAHQILLRIPGVADGRLCESRAPKATANYVNDASVDVFDFVLCLKRYSSR